MNSWFRNLFFFCYLILSESRCFINIGFCFHMIFNYRKWGACLVSWLLSSLGPVLQAFSCFWSLILRITTYGTKPSLDFRLGLSGVVLFGTNLGTPSLIRWWCRRKIYEFICCRRARAFIRLSICVSTWRSAATNIAKVIIFSDILISTLDSVLIKKFIFFNWRLGVLWWLGLVFLLFIFFNHIGYTMRYRSVLFVKWIFVGFIPCNDIKYLLWISHILRPLSVFIFYR